ncbi:BatA domain-containing protein [Pedobacter sp. MW01-1-1]|uniref:BatA domain-containing protein n=1 Tax=Pedobacter sp. MW01-1-1 TaxID=3383027 RepID=UPI003FED6380
MNFLYPGFLFALISVVIPIAIHLFNFRKFKKVQFSNVQLLKEVEIQKASQEKLKNLLILLARILAIVFMVLAFAQPYIPENQQKNEALGNIVSIYIDNSYSMNAVNKDGSLLDEAKRRAKDIVKGYGFNDRFQLLTNNFEGKHQRLLNLDEFLKALDDVKISGVNRNLQQIVTRQGNVLTGSLNKYSYLISDFQRNVAVKAPLDTKDDIQYAFLKLNASPLPNIAIDSVWMLTPNHQPGATEKLVVQVKNFSEEEAKNIPLKLTINSQQKALSSFNIPAGKTMQDTLSFSGLKSGWQKGLLTIKDFPITFDDSLYFSFNVELNLPVLSINGSENTKYIAALFGADAYFKLTENSERNVQYSTFSNYGLIVLNGIKEVSTGLAQQLKSYAQAGGTVVVFPNTEADITQYSSFLTSLSLPSIQKVVTTPSKVEKIDLENPLFKTVFEAVPKNIDLPSVNRYFVFNEQNSANKEDIMQLPGRGLYFAKYGIGDGQIYLSASGLNAADGDFARHAIFVPLLYRIAVNGGKESSLYAYLGTETALESKKINLGKNQTLKIVSDQFEIIPEIRQAERKTLVYTADQMKQTGFYQLKLADSLLAVYAFNANRSESDMHYLSSTELDNVSSKSNLKVFDSDKDALKLITGSTKIGQIVWKLCLILSLVFIAIEMLLIKFFNKPKSTT